MKSRTLLIRTLITSAALTLSFSSPVSAQVTVKEEKENVTASRLIGTWQLDEAINKRLGGTGNIALVTFTKDLEVAKKIPAKYSGFFQKNNMTAFIAGTLSFKIKGETMSFPYLLSHLKGNSHLFYFRPKDGDPMGDSESFNLSVVRGKTRMQDLLFIGGDFNNQPFSAFQRSFLEENKNVEGVKVTASGLQYKVIKAGDGASPTAKDKVEVHYEGKFVSGKIFDSSFKRGQTITFPLGRVVQGWREGLQLMKEGGEYMLYIPYQLAYGENGRPPVIPPRATLIFRIKLIKVVR